MLNLDKLTLEEILELRIKDLNLKITEPQNQNIQKLFKLLEAKGVNWKPHIWLSDEWFSPDGVSGFAIPFVLCHKKLIKLERMFLGECEGVDQREFLKLCCHETGHAIDNAYKLRLIKERQKIFGLTSKKYPQSYQPNLTSKEYITFLGDHYAQAHPDEDWAETFGHYLMAKNKKNYHPKINEKINLVHQIIKGLNQNLIKKT